MTRIPAAAVPDVLEEGTVLLDCREADEWAAGHAPQATLAPLSRINDFPFDPGTRYLTICRSGNRSLQLAMAMARAGFDVTDVEGGMQAWVRAGRPVVAETVVR